MAANPIVFHAERKRRVLEKEVRLIDGQIMYGFMPQVCFLLICHSHGLLHPVISVALFNAHTSQRLKKQKTSDRERGMVE